MHLPQGIKYIAIVEDDAKFALLHQVSSLILQDFAIKIDFARIEYNAFKKLIQVEIDRSFNIFFHSENEIFTTKAIKELKALIDKSCSHHKLCLFGNYDIKTLYEKMVGSLNLTYFFSRDGIIGTYGIQTEKETIGLESMLINEKSKPKNVEIANIRPIILDYSRCGVLEPSYYFVGIDFLTCIASVFDPDSMEWKTAYFIQCYDSGTMDTDMVKICFVNELNDGKDRYIMDYSTNSNWLIQAQALSHPESRFSNETVRNRSLRLETETKSGIIALPVLEPYLEVQWPKEIPKQNIHFPHSEIETHCKKLLNSENEILENKSFGL